MTLTSKQIREFRKQAHHLKPVVSLGDKGLTENVIAEIEQALYDHELIKIRAQGDKEDIKLTANAICLQTKANLIQIIGHVITVFCPSEKNKHHAKPKH